MSSSEDWVLALAASEQADVDLGLPEFQDDEPYAGACATGDAATDERERELS